MTPRGSTTRRIGVAALLFLASLAVGCRSAPTTPGGESLRCSEDADCPDGLRCTGGGCVFNSPPVVGPFSATTIFVGTPVSVQAEGFDADGDPVTSQWEQVEGPMLLAQPTPDGVLDVVPTDAGTYAFEVTADDGRGGATTARLTVIVVNPELQPFPRVFGVVNEPVSVTARAIEPENAPVVVQWTQVFGPGSPGAPTVGDTLQFIPDTLGRYVFDVAIIGEPMARAQVEVIVQPAPDAVYVNGSAIIFDPTGQCGTFDTPCDTLQGGVTAARNMGIDTILLAAHPPGQPYNYCLPLMGNESLQGGFDPVTWEYDPERLRASTVISCSSSAHLLSETSRAADVTLRIADVLNPIATNLFVTGAPTVENVDIVFPACGPGCFSAGISALDSDVVMTGVNIAADSGFAIAGSIVGMILAGGSPVIQGANPVRAPDDVTSRGIISLELPATGFANGILLARTTGAVIQGMLVEGSFGANIVGISVTGGEATVAGNVVDMTAFGALTAVGIAGTNCASDDVNCGCGAMACPGITDPILFPDMEARGNVIRIRSSAGDVGQVPCAGAAVLASGSQTGQIVEGNDIQVLGPFALGVGVILDTFTALTPGAPDSVSSNSIVIEEGRADTLCEDLGFASILGLGNGVFGIVASARGATVGNNDVSVGAHEETAGAFAAIQADGMIVQDNVLEVASTAHTSTTGATAKGVILKGDPAGIRSDFARNRVLVRDAAVSTIGVEVDSSPWVVANNFVIGGEGLATTGLRVVQGPQPGEWPRVIHNTIYAGGTNASVATTAVVVAAPIDSGRLLNNLLDGGSAEGRRMLLHPLGTGSFSNIQGNYGQFPLRSGGGLVPLAISGSTLLAGGGEFDNGQPGVTTFNAAVWNVFFQGAGQVITVEAGGSGIGEFAYAFLDRPTDGAWMGQAAGADLTLAWDDGTFYVSEIISGRPEEFAAYPTGGVQPRDAVVGDVDADNADIVFLDDFGVSWMPALSRLSFDIAQPLELTRGDLIARALTTLPPGRKVYILATSGAETFVEQFPRGSDGEEDSVDISAIIPGTAEFQWIYADRFDAGATEDLAIAHGTELDIFLNPSFMNPVGTWTAQVFPSPVCNGSRPDAVLGADFGIAISQKAVFVQCGDDVEAYFFRVSGILSKASWDDTEAGPSINLRPQVGIAVMRYDRQRDRLFVAGPNGGVAVYSLDATGLMPSTVSFTLEEQGVIQADGALRSTDEGVVTPAFGDGLAGQLEPAGPPFTPCPLAIRSGTPDDLHLSTDANPCIDGGADLAQLARTDDIDGLDTRVDATPDIGADERVP